MHSLVGLRAGRRTLRAGLGAGLVAVLALAVLLVTSAAGASGAPTPPVAPAPPAAPAGATAAPFGIIIPASGNIIVVQRAAGQDALWSVDPLTKVATKLVDLPFRPARVEQSPGGRRLVYLPRTAGPVVYVYDTHAGTLVSRSLASLGVKVVDSLTWLSSTKLLVAGKRTAGHAFYPFADRLYVLNTATGDAARFRGLHGTEPTVAPGARLVYVHLSDGGPVAGSSPDRWVIERLYRLNFAAGARPHLIASAKYPNGFDIRRFHDPRLSHDGTLVITSTTGSDVSVSYMVRFAGSGKVRQTVATTLSGSAATAWSHLSSKVAFWGMPPADNGTTTRLFVYRAKEDSLNRSSKLPNVAVTGLAWSADGATLAYTLRSLGSPDDVAELWTIDSLLSSSSATDIGPGSMPVVMP